MDGEDFLNKVFWKSRKEGKINSNVLVGSRVLW